MIRPASMDDASAMLSCWNDSMPFDQLPLEVLHEKLWADSDVGNEDILVDDRNGIVSGFGVSVSRAGRATGYIKMCAVARSFRGNGIGTDILDALEARLAGQGCQRFRLGESAPNYLVPGLDVRYEEGGAFFRRRGYRSVGRTMNLHVDLAALDSPDMSDHDIAYGAFHLRRATAEDRAGLMELLARNWSAWVPEVESALSNVPPTVHVAVCGLKSDSPGTIAAFSAIDANNKGTGWFGPMGTGPEWRGQGLGRQLMRRCLEDVRRGGRQSAVIPWVGPLGFYHAAVGARVARVFERMEKQQTLPSDPNGI